MQVEGLCREGVFEDVSFSAHRGEVLGFFGLVGAGRSEIMRAIFGVDKPERGIIRIKGQEVKLTNPVQATAHGLALVPEDRKKEGLALELSVLANMTLVKLPQISRWGFIYKSQQSKHAQSYIENIRVKTPIRTAAGRQSVRRQPAESCHLQMADAAARKF